MDEIHQILKKFWGFNSFRPLQEDIIMSVINGNDTLGLMPTGGGKSLTFQVPALYMKGICLVVTPLIALMKDQVETLQKKGIKAQAIYSGMTHEEIDIALNNCLYGDYKFLYLSPERLGTEIFKTRVPQMNVNIITVDEAHCISQWGYDFRPSYLKIASLRGILPGVPLLALTATATNEVIDDIQEKLGFARNNVMRASFFRKNLIYTVRNSEDKFKDIIKIATKIRGSGIVYVRTRKKSMDISSMLAKNGVSSSYYHAGIRHQLRAQRQQEWTCGKIRVIVATNAFGMGIDKHDVRFVIHADLPDSLESYFQEAGRAGRDGQKAYAVLLYNSSDNLSVKQRVKANFPEITIIKKIYNALGNYLRVPTGSGKNLSYDFNIGDFASSYKFNLSATYSSLKILEREGYIELTDELDNPSKVKFLLARDDLYKFQVANAGFDAFIKLLLRSYTGIFTEFVAIDELSLAKRAGVNIDIIYQYLDKLSKLKVIRYIAQKKTPLIIYTEERLDEKALLISADNYKKRKESYTGRLNAVLNYASKSNKCRSQVLLEYFGEKNSERCGQCDVCKHQEEAELNRSEFDLVRDEIKSIINLEPATLDELIDKIPVKEDKIVHVIQWLLDNMYIAYDENNRLIWKKRNI
jgi:ATP-dependent DNA helicase RecQ